MNPVISTRNLSRLPGIEPLRALAQSLATLDAIFSIEWEYRTYSFNSRWGTGEPLASMRNGSGDGWLCVFGPLGAFLKGFAHESAMSPWRARPPKVWPGVLDSVPAAFGALLTEPALAMEETTFCIWRGHGDAAWHAGAISFPDAPDPDGSADLLAMLDGNPATYQAWAETMYERTIDLAAIAQVYAHEPLTHHLVRAINDAVDFADLAEDIKEIGYPAAPDAWRQE
jgi:hypothetical protein